MKSRARVRRALGLAVATALVLAAPGRGLSAQSAPSVNLLASAAVVGEPVVVQEERDLAFGDVFTGTSVTVPVTSASSGRWLVTGQRNAEVRIVFDLPAELVSGLYALPISFGPASAGYHDRNVPQQATLFDPTAGAFARLRDHPQFQELYVWIGGAVAAALDQPGGLYSGTITLTVSYTGN